MSPANKLRVLYAEDDADTRELTCLILESDGFEVVCPDNLHDFLRLAKENLFDVYMLDTWMPGMSGIDLCKAIKEFDSQTPIIFYSAAAFERDRKEALDCGAQAYIIKPARFEELSKTIRFFAQASTLSATLKTRPS
jgi:DNA-binding response OmpR family regulator